MIISQMRSTLRRPLVGRFPASQKNGQWMEKSITGSTKRGIKSLAFTTYFLHPEFEMNDYEILSRCTASLLAVDPPDPTGSGPYGHLEAAEQQRKIRDFKREKGYTPPVGDGSAKDMGWLEYMPREHRPNVHCVTSSHVVSPFLWLDYYPLDWLTRVKQEHCKYTVEVIDSKNPKEPLASYELHNTPYHHPEGRDVALLHLVEEESALKEMKQMGVKVHHIRNPEMLFSKGETLFFDGFVVHDPTASSSSKEERENTNTNLTEEDTRIFDPHEEIGSLSSHTYDRFFAETSTPLQEGLCGAPVLDQDGDLCGIVEGIVPVDHENKKLAGNAAFLPYFVLKSFVDYTERSMLEAMMPKDIFQHVVRAKETNSIGGGSMKVGKDGVPESQRSWEEVYDEELEKMKKKYSKEEVDAIVWNVKRERDEVIKIMNEEGGDMDEVIERVRAKTYALREKAIENYKTKGGVPPGK